MSPLLFASMAPLLAKTPPVFLDNPARLTIQVQEGVRTLEPQSPLASPGYVALNIASPEFLEQPPDRVVASMPAQRSSNSPPALLLFAGQPAQSTAPAEHPVTLRYSVQPGDTLWLVAQRFNIPLQSLIDANPDVAPEKLPVGYNLIIPNPQQGGESNFDDQRVGRDASNGDDDANPQGVVAYTVQRGDTVWAIAQRFNIPPQAILDANPGIVPKKLQVNQPLTIPVASQAGETAKVETDGRVPFTDGGSVPLPTSSADDANAADATALPEQRLGAAQSGWLVRADWQVGAIALIGLGLTLAGWYGWQKRAEFQAMLVRFEAAMQPSPPMEEAPDRARYSNRVTHANDSAGKGASNFLWVQGGLAPDAAFPDARGEGAIASETASLSAQLLFQLTSFFGGLVTSLPFLSTGDSTAQLTLHPPVQDAALKAQEQTSLADRETRRNSVQTPPASPSMPAPAVSEVATFRPGATAPEMPGVIDQNELENWSTPIQNILDQPSSSLPLKLITGGALFCLMFGAWAWFGSIEEVGYAQGQLVPKGDVYEVEFPESGRIINVAVTEGEEVKSGQVLFELDTKVAEGEVRRLQDLLTSYQLKLQEKQGLIPQLQQESAALAQITQTTIEAQVAAIREVQAGAITTTSIIDQLQTDAAAQQERLSRISELVNEGAVSRDFMFQAEQTLRERQRNLIENQGAIQERQSQVSQLQAKLDQAQAEGQRQQIDLQQRLQQVQTEVVELQTQILDTKNLLSQEMVKLNQRYLYAPVDGIISSLQVDNAGEFVQPGETIAEIIPNGAPLILSAVLPSKEAGFVEAGMPVQIKLDAYPFQDYGVIPGRVEAIAPNTEVNEKLGAVYRVEISLDRNHLRDSNQDIQFKPGSTARAEIVIRRRRIADILLDPIKQLQTDGLNL